MNIKAVIKRQWVIWALVIIPVILFAIYIFKNAVNVPYYDDMELVYSVNTLKNHSLSVLSLLVQQQNDHRSAFPRLGIFLSFFLAGTLDFRLTILLGYFNLILLGFSLFLVLRSAGKSLIAFLPVSLLLFSPIVYADHLGSLTAFQHTLSIAFSILCLYFLRPEGRAQWAWSILCAVGAGLTNLDGVFAMVVGVFWLLTQKRWRESVLCSIFVAGCLYLYFFDFHFSARKPVGIKLEEIPFVFRCFLTVTGSLAKIISDTYSLTLSCVLGAVMVLTLVFVRVRRLRTNKTEDALSFNLTEVVFLKLLLSMAVISAGRFSSGIDSMIAIRFSIYSVSMGIAFYMLLLNIFRKSLEKRMIYVAIVGALMLSGYSYVKYKSAVDYLKAGMISDTYNYPRNGLFLHQYFNMEDPEPSFYRNYIFPKYFNNAAVSEWTRQMQVGEPDILIKWRTQDDESGRLYANHLYGTKKLFIQCEDSSIPTNEIYLTIKKNDGIGPTYILALRREGGNELAQLLRQNPKLSLSADLIKKLPHGDYKMALAWQRAGRAETRILTPVMRL